MKKVLGLLLFLLPFTIKADGIKVTYADGRIHEFYRGEGWIFYTVNEYDNYWTVNNWCATAAFTFEFPEYLSLADDIEKDCGIYPVVRFEWYLVYFHMCIEMEKKDFVKVKEI